MTATPSKDGARTRLTAPHPSPPASARRASPQVLYVAPGLTYNSSQVLYVAPDVTYNRWTVREAATMKAALLSCAAAILGLSSASAQEKQDDTTKRILDRIEKEIQNSHQRLLQDIR